MTILETNRIILRQIVPSDLNELYLMNSDPVVMKYIWNGSIGTLSQMKLELDGLISYYSKNPGLGIWAMVLKETNTITGAGGLVYYDNTREIEIGYRIVKEHWNKGHAIEMATGLLKYGFEINGLKKIVSSAHIDNAASIKVMKKTGMRYVDNRFPMVVCRPIMKLMLTGGPFNLN